MNLALYTSPAFTQTLCSIHWKPMARSGALWRSLKRLQKGKPCKSRRGEERKDSLGCFEQLYTLVLILAERLENGGARCRDGHKGKRRRDGGARGDNGVSESMVTPLVGDAEKRVKAPLPNELRRAGFGRVKKAPPKIPDIGYLAKNVCIGCSFSILIARLNGVNNNNKNNLIK